ncbi:MAG: hypothetical protein ACRD52_02075 [Candidatus Acidiferrales bacterium]
MKTNSRAIGHHAARAAKRDARNASSAFRNGPALASLLLGSFLFGYSTQGTTIERMSLARLSRTAPIIARARCLANATSWDAGEIWTFASFSTEEDWKGPAPAQFRVRLLGGRVGPLTSSVSGVPHFQLGEEVVLFLEPSGRGDFRVTSWVQGTFRIHRNIGSGEELVTQDTASYAAYNPATRRYESGGVRDEGMAEFRARVNAALAGDSHRP